MKKISSIVGMLTCLLCLIPIAVSQDPATTGSPNFGASDVHQYDTIDLMSNTIVLNVPILSKNGSPSFTMGLSANSGMTSSTVLHGTLHWNPYMADINRLPQLVEAPWVPSVNGVDPSGQNGTGGSGNSLALVAYASANTSCTGGSGNVRYSKFALVSAHGTVHKLPTSYVLDSVAGGTCINSFSGAIATDLSGWTVAGKTSGGFINLVSATQKNGTSLVVSGGAGFNGTITDRNGNVITIALSPFPTPNTATYTDSMGQTVLTYSFPATHGSSYYGTYSWTDFSQGVTTPSVQENYTAQNIATNFACGTGFPADILTTDGETKYLPSSMQFADGTTLGFAFEPTPSHTTYTTARIKTLTLPQGGTVTYTYPGTINCAQQTPVQLTRTLGNGDVSTYALSYVPVNTSVGYASNTVISAGSKKSIYNFLGFTGSPTVLLDTGHAQLLGEVIKYNGTTGITLDKHEFYCYNGSATASACLALANAGTVMNQQYSYPITARAHLVQLDQGDTWSAEVETYDTYGNVTDRKVYDYATSFTSATPLSEDTYSYGSWSGSSCTAFNSAVRDKVCELNHYENGNLISHSRFTHDTANEWNLLKVSKQINSTTYIGNTTNNVYNGNGTPSKTYDLNNNETDYSYLAASYTHCTGCSNYPFPTQIKNAGTGNYTNFTYYGDGGVVASQVDRNSATKTYTYSVGGVADPYWRPLQITDPLGAVQTNTYPNGTTPTTSSSVTTLNSGNSITGAYYQTDGYGRLIKTQVPQSPTGSMYDTISTTYSSGGTVKSSEMVPCSAGLLAPCSFSTLTITSDNLGRVTSTVAGNQTVTHTYQPSLSSGSHPEEIVTLSPPTTGENNKTSLTIRDALGRTLYACNVGGGYTASCGDTSNTGVVNHFIYNTNTFIKNTGIHRTASSTDTNQSKYITYEALGRQSGFFSPEISGNHDLLSNGINTYYDTVIAGCSGSVASSGNLTCKTDNVNYSIYTYDSQNRLTDVKYGVNGSGTTFCKKFRYDNSTGVLGTRPTGVTLSNQYGRLVEAETDDCTTPLTTAHQLSDEWFGYDDNGNKTDIWQWSPNSSGYLHTSATFFENGKVATQTWVNPSSYVLTYTLDGEGKLASTKNTTNNILAASGATYFPASNPATVNVFTSDQDSFVYADTGKVQNYTETVGSANSTTALTWNSNGTLKQSATTDGFFAAGSLTCTDTHDDFIRLTSFDCGSGNWGQNFTYDSRDNMNKSLIGGRTGTTWAATYDQGTNRYSGTGSYDANGNVTNDGNQVYFYNEVGKMKSTATSGTPNCGTSGRCMFYDAFDRPVETSNGANFTERFYAQSGMALLVGSSINTGYWAAPLGGTYVEASTRQYLHPDPFGSTRIISSFGHATTLDVIWTPFGEQAATPQTNGNNALYQFQNMLENWWKGVMFDGDGGQFVVAPSRNNVANGFGNWNLYKYSTEPLGAPFLPEGTN